MIPKPYVLIPEPLICPVRTDAIAVVDGFVKFGIEFVESKLGPVEPIGDIYLGVVNTLCHTYLDEFNMAWAAIGFILGSVQQPRLSSQFSFQFCNLQQLLYTPENVAFHHNFHFNLQF